MLSFKTWTIQEKEIAKGNPYKVSERTNGWKPLLIDNILSLVVSYGCVSFCMWGHRHCIYSCSTWVVKISNLSKHGAERKKGDIRSVILLWKKEMGRQSLRTERKLLSRYLSCMLESQSRGAVHFMKRMMGWQYWTYLLSCLFIDCAL